MGVLGALLMGPGDGGGEAWEGPGGRDVAGALEAAGGAARRLEALGTAAATAAAQAVAAAAAVNGRGQDSGEEVAEVPQLVSACRAAVHQGHEASASAQIAASVAQAAATATATAAARDGGAGQGGPVGQGRGHGSTFMVAGVGGDEGGEALRRMAREVLERLEAEQQVGHRVSLTSFGLVHGKPNSVRGSLFRTRTCIHVCMHRQATSHTGRSCLPFLPSSSRPSASTPVPLSHFKLNMLPR